jgi:hypothetical protein
LSLVAFSYLGDLANIAQVCYRFCMDPIQISASRLGEILVDGVCQRCYWLKLRVNHRLPFGVFPSIFNSIDSYTKDIVHSWFDVHGMSPQWLSQLGPITGYQKPKSWRQFQTTDHEYVINLRGEADAIFKHPDGSYLIADYKTARFRDCQWPSEIAHWRPRKLPVGGQ